MWSKIFTTVKYTLVSVNFLFLITGIIVLAVGISVQRAYNAYYVFLSDQFFSLPAFCIATGVIILLIAFFGFYGAFMENYYMSMAFAGSMVVLFIFQLSACIAGYVLKGNTLALVQQQLISTMPLYGNGTDKSYEITKLWDEVQADFSCCGVTEPSDWLQPLGTVNTKGLPMSCCSHVFGTVHTAECNTTNSFQTGCGPAFGEWVKSHARSIGVTGIFLVLMQALAVVGSLWMAKIARQDRVFP